MLEKENKFYKANQDELVKKYLGKFLVIKGEEIVGVFETETDAYKSSLEKYQLGDFLIKHCLPKEQTPPQVFHSRVMIRG